MPEDSDELFEYMEANPQCVADAVGMTFWISDVVYPVEARERAIITWSGCGDLGNGFSNSGYKCPNK
jgi:hypothetical protein